MYKQFTLAAVILSVIAAAPTMAQTRRQLTPAEQT
jgi:hypothetical protein